MLRKTITYLLLLASGYFTASAQEVVTGLSIDRIIYDNKKDIKGMTALKTVDLPFFDDFSKARISPDPNKWTDDFAFINNTYSQDQITAGIATLDALDNTGRLYENASQYVFEADHLTSQPLNLAYLPSDSILMSFLYQPGGLGDTPEPGDSLTLQFYSPADQKWHSVWRTAGRSSTGFKTVMLPIKDQKYLAEGFRFRFINYASLGATTGDASMLGNSDHWNIDYVLIDRNRSVNDTVFADVAFRLPMRSLLNTYETMPWEQFRQIYVYLREMGSFIKVNYRNNDTIKRNVTRNFEIRDVYNNTVAYSFSSGASNIDPLSNVDYSASLFYTYSSKTVDSALFRVTCSLITDEFDPKVNDTMVYYQKFGNYFAFDDGSSEGGYGVNGLGSRNAMVAYRFQSLIQDTVRAISICFNQSYMNSNQRTFDLMIWGDNNGIPGDLLYSKDEVVVHKGETINGFYDYVLPHGIAVSDVFYVGWRQRSETFMNAGFDVNTPNKGRQFYWLNGNWFQSQVSGSLMIRPVMGRPLTTGIRNILYTDRPYIKVWPNPAGSYINIDAGDRHDLSAATVTITDMHGRKLMEVPFKEQINIESINEGICFVTITLRNRIAGVARFIKLR
jgi:hypothetical protein